MKRYVTNYYGYMILANYYYHDYMTTGSEQSKLRYQYYWGLT